MIDPSANIRKGSCQGGVEKGMTWSSLEVESIKEVGIEVDICDDVTIAEPRVELESEKDKEDWERELDRSTTLGPSVRDGIAKADKFVEQKVITASLGRTV
jgi:hypothetical protein